MAVSKKLMPASRAALMSAPRTPRPCVHGRSSRRRPSSCSPTVIRETCSPVSPSRGVLHALLLGVAVSPPCHARGESLSPRGRRSPSGDAPPPARATTTSSHRRPGHRLGGVHRAARRLRPVATEGTDGTEGTERDAADRGGQSSTPRWHRSDPACLPVCLTARETGAGDTSRVRRNDARVTPSPPAKHRHPSRDGLGCRRRRI